MNQTDPLPLRILLVEDNDHDYLAFRRAFQKSDDLQVEITRYTQAEKALERLLTAASSFDLVVTDYKLPGMSGLGLCRALLAQAVPLPLVLLTGAGTEKLAVEALKAGVDDYLIKNVELGYLELLPVVLPDVVRKHGDRLARRRAEKLLHRYENRLEILHRSDRALLAARSAEEIARAALEDVSQLVPCRHVCIVLFDLELDQGLILAARCDQPVQPDRQAFALTSNWPLEKLRRDRLHMVEDIQVVSPPSELTQFLQAYGVRSIVDVPLVAQDNLIGVLNLGRVEPGFFNTEQIDIIHEIADQIALGVQQARLYEQVRQYTTDLERQVAERTAALKERTDQLSALSQRLAEVQEIERRQLAQELHDQIGQSLSALDFSIGVLDGLIPDTLSNIDQLRSILNNAQQLVSETSDRIRDVMASLRPPVLDDHGLIAALRWYAEQFSTYRHLSVAVHGEEPTPRLPEQIENTLLRIAQEAMNNTAKHAQATRLTVTFEAEAGLVRMRVVDDGVGFEPAKAAGPIEPSGWGLLIMSERAKALNARYQVESGLGKGTQITVEIPLES